MCVRVTLYEVFQLKSVIRPTFVSKLVDLLHIRSMMENKKWMVTSVRLLEIRFLSFGLTLDHESYHSLLQESDH